jgi:hypothetical protein
MSGNQKGSQGLNRLVQKFRSEFRRPENTNFYTEKDYKKAERKYIKLCLKGKLKSFDTE